MWLEITTMKVNYHKDIKAAPDHKKKWSKSKRTFLRAKMGERRRKVRVWSARRPPLSPDRIDGNVTADVNVTSNQSYVPSVAMAPRNTTQYLMDLVYAERLDVCDVSHDFSTQTNVSSDESFFSMSDSDYDRSLDFQQRDFESVFFRNEIWPVSETWLDFVGTRWLGSCQPHRQ